MEQLSLFSLQPKVERAIENFRIFEEMALRMHPEGYYLAFSGGKDSQVIYHLAKMAGVRFQAHYHITTVDPPELVKFIKEQYPNVQRVQPRISMWNLIVKKQFPPTRRVRYCCSELKEQGGKGRFLVTGVRWSESEKRKSWSLAQVQNANREKSIILLNDNNEKRRTVENCTVKGKYILNPILDWSVTDVWNFLHQYRINYCKLYDCGFSRLGCIGCPMAAIRQRKWELERYPKYKQAYLKTFERMLLTRPELNRKDFKKWESAEDVYHWWLYGYGKPEIQVSGQFTMNFKEKGGEISHMKNDKTNRLEKNTYEGWSQELRDLLCKWNNVKEDGAIGEMWTDGVTLNQIREKMLEVQDKLKRYDNADVPEIPNEMPEDYMAHAEEIRMQAKKSAALYLASSEYRYLRVQLFILSQRQIETTQILTVIGRIRALEDAIERDDLVVMREYGGDGLFNDLLAETDEKIKNILLDIKSTSSKTTNKEKAELEENQQLKGQMSIYDLAS